MRSSGTRTVCELLDQLGYTLVRRRFLDHDVYGDGWSFDDENICTQIHNITDDVQMTKYPVIVPLRYPGRTLATGGLDSTINPDLKPALKRKKEQALIDRLQEFNKFIDICLQIEATGEVLYFPIDAMLDETKLFQTLLDYTGATGSLDATSGFPRAGRTGKGDCPFSPDHPDFRAAEDFYDARVEQVRGILGGI
jgi:hypothetical protein